MNYERALILADEKLLTRKEIKHDSRYEIFCYSKTAFWDKEWNDITLTHRGMIYKNGKQLNRPFVKIFNVNEHESTQYDNLVKRMAKEDYSVYDKANGHLFLACVDVEENTVIFSTKGSFSGDIGRADIALAKHKGLDTKLLAEINSSQHLTFMFEVLAEHDKHALYDVQKKQYSLDGEDTLVLLGINAPNRELSRHEVEYWSYYLQLPVIKKYNNKDVVLDDMFFDTGIEGYVIHFHEDDFRFKIKTEEYWKIRLVNNLKLSNIVDMYIKSGIDGMHQKLPEELFFSIDYIKRFVVDYCGEVFKTIDRKEIAKGKAVYYNSGVLSRLQLSVWESFCDMTIKSFDRMVNSRVVRDSLKEQGTFESFIEEHEEEFKTKVMNQLERNTTNVK